MQMPDQQVSQPSPALELTIPPSKLNKYIGTYRFSHFAELTISVENGVLMATATGERDIFQVKRVPPAPCFL